MTHIHPTVWEKRWCTCSCEDVTIRAEKCDFIEGIKLHYSVSHSGVSECSSDLERKSVSDTDESYWFLRVKKGDRCICQRDLISLWIMGNKWSFKKKQRLAAARWLFRTKRMKCGITQRSLNNNKKSYSCRIPAEFMRLEPRFPSRDRGCTRLLLQWVTSSPCSQLRGVAWGKELLLYVDPPLQRHWSQQFITYLLVSVQFWPGLYLIWVRMNY